MNPYTYELQAKIEDWHWWFVGRRKIIFSFLDRVLDKNKSLKILDVGCGTGKNLTILNQYGQAVGIDELETPLAICAQKRISNVARASCVNIPFQDNSFDLVTALDVLEHVEDDNRALKECCRVLKQDGTLLVSVPAFSFLWGLQDEVSHHKRRYTKKNLVEKLRQAGFEIQKATYFNFLLFAPIFVGRLILKFIPHRLKSENDLTAPGINWLLKNIFASEAVILNKFNLPFGVSLAAIGRKVLGLQSGPSATHDSTVKVSVI